MRQQDRDGPGHTEAGAARAKADDEVGPAFEPDDGDEAGQADRLEHPERRPGDAAEEARPRGAQPAADQASEQDTHAHTQANLDTTEPSAGIPISAPDDDTERDDNHVGRVRRAIGDADEAHGVFDPARGPDEREDVAAVDPRCPGRIVTGVPTRRARRR